jgi:uncharacterized protein (TIGR02284 family)
MKTSEETIEILNDIIQINNDRIRGYERAIEELKEDNNDLKTLFEVCIDQSRQNRMVLGKEVQAYGGEMTTGTTGRGKIYRAWMDVKAVFAGHDRQAVLENCEFGEDAALKAYETALKKEDLPEYLKVMLFQQHDLLFKAHQQIKALRDQYVHQ